MWLRELKENRVSFSPPGIWVSGRMDSFEICHYIGFRGMEYDVIWYLNVDFFHQYVARKMRNL